MRILPRKGFVWSAGSPVCSRSWVLYPGDCFTESSLRAPLWARLQAGNSKINSQEKPDSDPTSTEMQAEFSQLQRDCSTVRRLPRRAAGNSTLTSHKQWQVTGPPDTFHGGLQKVTLVSADIELTLVLRSEETRPLSRDMVQRMKLISIGGRQGVPGESATTTCISSFTGAQNHE